MPRVSVWAIRLALLHLLAGTAVGSALLGARAGLPLGGVWALRAAHVEVLLIGFAVQLALGVAYWILPRRGNVRGLAAPVAVGLALVNAGVVAVAAAGLGAGAWLLLAGRAAEAVGVGVAAVGLLRRVGVGSRP